MTATQAERPPHVPLEQVVAFDLFNAPGAEQDFHRALSVLQKGDTADLVWTPFNGGHWIATRGQTIRTVYSDYNFLSRVVPLPKVSGELFNMLPLTLDPPQHRLFRNLLNGGLAPRIVAQMEDKVRAYAVAREVVRDMEFAGFQLKKGEMIAIPTFLSGLDARENQCPFEMDLGREQIFHTTFGGGVHSCPGKYLGLLELRVTLEEWLGRFTKFRIRERHEVRMTGGIVGSVNALPMVWD